MRTSIQILLLFLVFTFMTDLYGQESKHKSSPKAKKAFDNAMHSRRLNDLDNAEKELRRAIGLDSLFVDPYILLGDICLDKKRPGEAIFFYKNALELDPEKRESLVFLLGLSYLENGDHKMAAEQFQVFYETEGVDEQRKASAERLYQISLFRKETMENPVPFQPVNLGPSVNSQYDEFVNSITLDEQQLVYTHTKPDSVKKGHFVEGFEMAVKEDSVWIRSGRALPDLHSLGNVGAMSLSPDGKFLFFTSCSMMTGYGSCDLYVCGKKGDGWTKPQNLGGVVNAGSWDSQPCFSADGKTLFFSSSRAGGEGGSDIWISRWHDVRGWNKPVNAGKGINTSEEEMAPFIHPDGKTLYFSSKGHPGMGGFDLFIARMDSTGDWLPPENLGWPVNTGSDEINIVVATNGKAAYLSSDQEEGYGGYDIYRFDLPESAAPGPVSYLEGYVYDALTNEPLEAFIELIDLISGEQTVQCRSEEGNGYYIAALPGGRNYALNISKQGYMFYSKNFDLKETHDSDPQQMDVYLQPVRAGQSFVLNNIFFDTDKYSLSDLSLVELYKLNAFLVQNQDIRIMICGHTDNVGSEEYNQELSEKRARAVYSFLIETGIQPSRLEYKGFGFSQPVSENDTDEGRALNRRTEILIL